MSEIGILLMINTIYMTCHPVILCLEFLSLPRSTIRLQVGDTKWNLVRRDSAHGV